MNDFLYIKEFTITTNVFLISYGIQNPEFFHATTIQFNPELQLPFYNINKPSKV